MNIKKRSYVRPLLYRIIIGLNDWDRRAGLFKTCPDASESW